MAGKDDRDSDEGGKPSLLRSGLALVAMSALATVGGLWLCVGQTSAPPRSISPIVTATATTSASVTASASATASSSDSQTASAEPSASATVSALADGPLPPPSPGETRVRAIWDAAAQRRPGNALLGGLACTVEATLANVASAIVPRGVTVRCGDKALVNPDGIPAQATITATEIPGIERGSYVYTLQYRDGRTEIDTRHGRVEVDLPGPPPGTAYLIVTNESRPVKQKLVPETPDDRVLQAGTRPSEDDDRVNAKVTAATGDTLVRAGDRCGIALHPYGKVDGVERCDVLVQCGGVTLIGRPELFSSHCWRSGKRVTKAQDPEAQPADNDPGLILDERAARIWNDAAGSRWSVLLAIDPR